MPHANTAVRTFGQRPGGPTEREREDRFKKVLEGMPCAVLVIGEAGDIRMVNAHATRLFGYEPGELRGQPVENLLPESFRIRHGRASSQFQSSRFARRLGTGKLDVLRKDGSLFPAEFTLTSMEGEHDTMVVAAVIDRTEKLRLDGDAAFLAALVASSADAIVGKDLEGRVRTWNASAQRMFGYTSAEMVGKSVDVIVPPNRRAEIAALHARVAQGESIQEFETVRRAKDGREFAVLLTVFPVRRQDGTIQGGSAILRDISETKAAAETLHATEARLRCIFEYGGQGMLILDGEAGVITDINATMASLFGYPIEEMRGSSLQELCNRAGPADQDEGWARLDHGRVARKFDQFDLRCWANDGRPFWTEVILLAVTADQERKSLAIVRDVDERRAAQRALAQSQKMEAIDQLTSGVAHDFNNLLAIIYGNLELIREAVGDDPALSEMVVDALDASERGASVTKQLLAYSRQQSLEPRLFRADEALAEVVGLIARTFGAGLQISTSATPDTWSLLLDPHQFQVALLNLALNARDAMPNGGKLTFEVSNRVLDDTYARHNGMATAGRYVQVAVSDTGEGIARDLLEKVIEPFFTTKPVGKGTGLGLSMVYGFVKQSGGNLKIYSEPGTGTTITLLLPTQDVHSASQEPVEAVPGSPAGETILVVEDDASLRKLVVRVLSDLGYRVLKAASGAEALRILDDEGSVDLLVSDLILASGMNGAQVAQAALARDLAHNVLFMSGYARQAACDIAGLDADAQLLNKPFLNSELATKVREMLDQPPKRAPPSSQ